MIDKVKMNELMEKAKEIAKKAYVPYSKFNVGAALLCEDGKIITGVNVENRSFGLTVCAERNAVGTAVALGYQKFLALAVYTPYSETIVGPCGACRQVLSEFMPPEAPVSFCGENTPWVDTTVGELYPLDSLHELRK